MRAIQFSADSKLPLRIPEPFPCLEQARGRSRGSRFPDLAVSSQFASSRAGQAEGIQHAPGKSLIPQKLWRLLEPVWQPIQSCLPGFLVSTHPKPVSGDTQQKIDSDWVFFPQLPDEPLERGLSKFPQKKVDFPKLSPRNIRLEGNYKKEAEMLLPNGKTGCYAFQYGNLNEHGAFWLEDIHGSTLGLLSRERSQQTFGSVAPLSFYPISLKLPDPELPEPLQKSIQNRLIRQAVQQAKSNYLRLIVEPESRDEAHLFRKYGFVNLQTSLNRYVPPGQNNPSQKRVGDLLAFDGFLEGYGANFFSRNAVNSAMQRN